MVILDARLQKVQELGFQRVINGSRAYLTVQGFKGCRGIMDKKIKMEAT